MGPKARNPQKADVLWYGRETGAMLGSRTVVAFPVL